MKIEEDVYALICIAIIKLLLRRTLVLLEFYLERHINYLSLEQKSQMNLLYDLGIGVFSSIVTLCLFYIINRYRIERVYKNVIGHYVEVDIELNPVSPSQSYEVSFSMNHFGDAPELKLNFISGNEDKADWQSIFPITPPNFFHLVTTFKYLKNKNIKDFDFNDVGVHNIYIIPKEQFIQVEVTGVKHRYPKHSYTIKKV
jgi:hypothetical protein